MPSFDDKAVLLYQHIMDELKELRNERWKLAVYFTSISLGNIFLLKERLLFSCFFEVFRWTSVIVQAFSMIIFVWLIIRNHHYLTRSRGIRNKLEVGFEFHSVKDSDGSDILPPSWNGKRAEFQFELVDITIPIIAFTVLCQISAIVVLLTS